MQPIWPQSMANRLQHTRMIAEYTQEQTLSTNNNQTLNWNLEVNLNKYTKLLS